MKTKLTIVLCCLMAFTLSLAQEQSSWWQEDGSLKIENAEYTFRSNIVRARKDIKEGEMLLVDLTTYYGQEQNDVNYGIYSKDLGRDELTELKIFHRKKLDDLTDKAPLYGFQINDDSYLIYGCKTNSEYQTTFLNQENNWNAYGYYAHGWSFSKTEIKSTDYKHLWNRPKSATWWDTFRDFTVGLLVVIVVVAASIITFGGADAFLGIAYSIASVISVTTAFQIMATLTLGGIFVQGYLLTLSSKHHQLVDKQELRLIPQLEFETNMELRVPNKYGNPKDEDEINWNRAIDKYLKASFKCTDFPGEKCFRAPITEVVAQMKIKNAHVKYVNIPGEIKRNLTPYQLFKNYEYELDESGEVILDVSFMNNIKEAERVFDNKEQVLPKKLYIPRRKRKIELSLENFKSVATYYIISKEKPKENELYYRDLGLYGTINGIVYNLYKFQPKRENRSFSFSTGPEGPFLAGDNLKIKENDFDLSVEVYRYDDDPIIRELYSLSEPNQGELLDFSPGDSVVFSSKHKDFLIKGIPEIWLARSAGESKYYCSPSIKPNEYRPFLGFDSQVHGVAVRKYPDSHRIKTPSIKFDDETGLYTWYWIAQRRMDPGVRRNNLLNIGNVEFKKYKEAKNLGATSFPIGGGLKVEKQRNNQREGYNMQLLYAWNKEGNTTIPDYKNYNGPNFLLGTDPDEIIYLGSNGAKIPSTKTSIPKALLKIDIEEWKRLPEGSEADPINLIVTAYKKNRNFVEGTSKEVLDYDGYEILDKGNYREYNIPGVTNMKPCNGKPCVKFFRDGIGEGDDNNKAPGFFTFKTNEGEFDIPISLKSPQTTDSGFYGSIEGDQWPSEWQKNVPYSFTGLKGLSGEVLNTLVMEYTHENELGILTKDTRYFRDGGSVSLDGKWTEHFDLRGWGYNEITVYVQRKEGATMIPIAGMELLEVMIRFVSVPGSKWKDFSPEAFKGVDLKEGRGEGNFWYLRDSNNDISDSPIYGRPLDDINKSYTISKGDEVVFNAMDSDPHTFFHYDVEWYVSERFMAKRLLPADLAERIQWFIAPVDYEGLGEFVGKGRWLDKTFDEPGKYRLTAVYGKEFDKNNDNYGNTRMSHEITVMSNVYSSEEGIDKGRIQIHPMSPDQIDWLNNNNNNNNKRERVNSSWRVAEVTNIFSKWTHVDGPRADPPNDKPNRYGLENDYNAHFKWYLNGATSKGALITSLPYDSYLIDDSNLEWFPSNWIRHYSGNTLPKDMDISVVSGGVTSTQEAIDNVLNTTFPKNLPEPWQWRLPWVSLTNWQGYRTRANIKVVFNMKKLFDNQEGAFTGKGNQSLTDEEYAKKVSNPIPNLTDKRKSKYDFYLDLLSGRKVVFNPVVVNPNQFSVHQVDDVKKTENTILVNTIVKEASKSDFLMGADMSIVKNLEDGGVKWNILGTQKDPYKIISEGGGNVARFRLWVNPKYSDGSKYNYSNLESVTNEILRAKRENLKVILDLHYSDTWTDPKQNIIPESWNAELELLEHSTSSFDRIEFIANKVKVYTKDVLAYLSRNGAYPDIVQIGNEINGNLLLSKPYKDLAIYEIAKEIGVSPSEMKENKYTINWDRNAKIINAGLEAVHSFSPRPETMLHIAGPLFAEYWLNEAFNADALNRLGKNVVDKEKVDIIGLSYYKGEPEQEQSIYTVQQIIENIGDLYDKNVLIVETAFPKTYNYSDNTTNLYGQSTRGAWPEVTSPSIQLEWLINLRETLKVTKHSIGFVYWEPFWVGSNSIRTKDFIGSNWENMSFFSFDNGVTSDVNNIDINGGYNVFFDSATSNDNYTYSRNNHNSKEEQIPDIETLESNEFKIYPNPTSNEITIVFDNKNNNTIELLNLQGMVIYKKHLKGIDRHIISAKKLNLSIGIYIIRVVSENGVSTKKIIIE